MHCWHLFVIAYASQSHRNRSISSSALLHVNLSIRELQRLKSPLKSFL